MDANIYWIWLSLACTPGGRTFSKLLSHFDTPKQIYEESTDTLRRIVGSSADADALCDKATDEAERILDFCIRREVGILTYADARFPAALRAIENPPVLLYYRGVLPDFSSGLYVGVVGTRHLSSYGKRMAFSIGHDLAAAGAVVVSGMAVGVDGVALAGALSCERPTVAVIGSGIDVCYPEAHLTLAREIVKRGCVLTEYAPKEKPVGFHFPVRNRLISGLSQAVAVIEGGENSGALITARCAKEQGKAVYAVPGNADNPACAAANILIRDGGKLLLCADDIIRDFADRGITGLNPFALPKKAHIPQSFADSVLSAYRVACVTTDDRVFRPSPSRNHPKAAAVAAAVAAESVFPQDRAATVLNVAAPVTAEPAPEPDRVGLDKALIRLYHKIPYGEECLIESLADEEFSMRDVLNGLLKLEMLRMVALLPGEKVRRA